MKSKELFVSSQAEKIPNDYLIDEIMADSSDFVDSDYDVVIKFIRGAKQTEEQRAYAKNVLGGWWTFKYGFPFELKAEREEILRRKYAPNKEMRETALLQKELLAAIATRNEDKIRDLKRKYENEFPEQLEGVEVLFALPDLLKKTKTANDNRERGIRMETDFFKDLCESQFLITHFIMLNSGDKPFLNQFWQVMESIAERDGTRNELKIVRRGIVSQVSVDLILQELGMNPQLAHPREDAFEKTDMWIECNIRVQVKSSIDIAQPAVIKTDDISFPAIEVRQGSHFTPSYFGSQYFHEASQFRARIKKISPGSEGLLLVIPSHMIDFVTGQPDEKLVEFFRGKIKTAKESNP